MVRAALPPLVLAACGSGHRPLWERLFLSTWFLAFRSCIFLLLHPAQRVVALGLLSRSPFDGAKVLRLPNLAQDRHLYETCCLARDSCLIYSIISIMFKWYHYLLCAPAHSLQCYVLVLRILRTCGCMYWLSGRGKKRGWCIRVNVLPSSIYLPFQKIMYLFLSPSRFTGERSHSPAGNI